VAAIATRAPRRPRRRAVANPIPSGLPAPVTSATLPSNAGSRTPTLSASASARIRRQGTRLRRAALLSSVRLVRGGDRRPPARHSDQTQRDADHDLGGEPRPAGEVPTDRCVHREPTGANE